MLLEECVRIGRRPRSECCAHAAGSVPPPASLDAALVGRSLRLRRLWRLSYSQSDRVDNVFSALRSDTVQHTTCVSTFRKLHLQHRLVA
eukprot:3086184-Prymnesium_polylepis.1